MICEKEGCSHPIGPTQYVFVGKDKTYYYCSLLCQHNVHYNDNCGVPVEPKKQVGGSHYKKYKIEPIDFVYENNIPYIEANVIKYIVRHRDKNGLQDLEKAKHYIEMLIEREYGYGTKGQDRVLEQEERGSACEAPEVELAEERSAEVLESAVRC